MLSLTETVFGYPDYNKRNNESGEKWGAPANEKIIFEMGLSSLQSSLAWKWELPQTTDTR